MNLSKKTRWLCCIVFCFLTMLCCVTVYAAKNDTGQAVIGIAWRADTDSEFYTNVCQAIEAAGGRYVLLPQVTSSDLNYNSSGFLLEGVDETGALTESASQKLRTYSWKHSNASDATSRVSAVVFTGGEDISSSLFAVPQPWHGIEAGRDFNAERDTSDYLLMSYCLEQNIPVMGFCRGMQMLSVVSGASMIQDLPTYFTQQGIPYHYEHRNEKASPDAYRDYAPHSILIQKNSLLYDMMETEVLNGCPSWHHQAVASVEGTPLIVTASTDTDGISIIEAVERTDKAFVIGLQFHPEAAIVKHLNHAANADQFLDYDTALRFFQRLVQEADAYADQKSEQSQLTFFGWAKQQFSRLAAASSAFVRTNANFVLQNAC